MGRGFVGEGWGSLGGNKMGGGMGGRYREKGIWKWGWVGLRWGGMGGKGRR